MNALFQIFLFYVRHMVATARSSDNWCVDPPSISLALDLSGSLAGSRAVDARPCGCCDQPCSSVRSSPLPHSRSRSLSRSTVICGELACERRFRASTGVLATLPRLAATGVLDADPVKAKAAAGGDFGLFFKSLWVWLTMDQFGRLTTTTDTGVDDDKEVSGLCVFIQQRMRFSPVILGFRCRGCSSPVCPALSFISHCSYRRPFG